MSVLKCLFTFGSPLDATQCAGEEKASRECIPSVWRQSIAMGEKKDKQGVKKVRFDLNEEVFLIPNKWDRLAKNRTARNINLIGDLASKPKTRTLANRQAPKSKQNKTLHAKSSPVGKARARLSPESNGTLADTARPTRSSPRRRRQEQQRSINRGSSTTSTEVTLKLFHRPSKELPGLDFVLPKIPYTPVLKQAIEKALQRSRRISNVELGLQTGPQDHAGEKSELLYLLSKAKSEKVLQRSLSDSCLGKGDEETAFTGRGAQDSSKFSELSTRLDRWMPFSVWASNENALQSKATVKRVRSITSIIPNSILY